MTIAEHPTCWLCGQAFSEVYWEKPGADRGYNTRYLHCTSCGLATVSPYTRDANFSLEAPEAGNYVKNIDHYAPAVVNQALVYMITKMEDYWFKSGHKLRGRLLDVGCAAGYFLFTAEARGWTVQGIEMGREIAEWGQKYLHVPIQIGAVETIALPDEAFDVIVAIEVLEHVLDPRDFLRTLYPKLKPGGMVFMTTPNLYSARYFPPEATTAILDPADHLNLFSQHALHKLVAEFPFSPFYVEADGPDGLQLQVYAHKPERRLLEEVTHPAPAAAQVIQPVDLRYPKESSALMGRMQELWRTSRHIWSVQGPRAFVIQLQRWLRGERRYHRK